MSESFEDARIFAQVIMSDCDVPIISRLQRAHEREMEHMRKAAYHRGYVAGQRSMDAEHRAIASKVMQVPYDDDAMEFLFHISAIICGGYYTSNKLLRDELIRLMGGVHDGISDCVCGGACADGCRDGHGQQEAVDVDDSVSDVRADVPAADGVDYSAAAQMTYDVLGNERHKAVCELRKMTINSDYFGNYQRIAHAIGTEYDGKSLASECVRDRLIHLLGGDEPYSNLTQTILEPNLPKSAETINLGGKHDSELMENGENHKIATIADELRECVNTATKTHDDTPWHEMGDESDADHTICHITEGELLRVADSIDEWFKRLCKQQETVLQDTIDDASDECDRLIGECNELQAKLEEADAAIANWRERESSFEESERERDELRKSLRQIAEHAGVTHDRDLSEYSDEKIANAVIGQLGNTNQYIKSLEWVRDRRLPRIEAERYELRAKLDTIREALDE